MKNLEGAQMVLVDTPGLHRPSGHARSQLNQFMVEEALAAIADVDAILLLVEAPAPEEAKKIAKGGYRLPPPTRFVLDTLASANKPAVLAVNKIDLLHNKQLMLPVMEAWGKAHPFKALVPISAVKGTGTDALLKELVALLPEGERLFPEEMLTDRAERWIAAEMIREQVFLLTREEVPYSVAVTIDTWEEREEKGKHEANVMIEATVHVEKEPQKRILVGEGGRMVREIGTRARNEIGQLLDCEVHLKLFVRVDPEWTQNRSGLLKMGYE